MDPFLDKGHIIFMDNYYNSIDLSNALLLRKTPTTDTLCGNHKGNHMCVITKKLKSGEYTV